MYAALWRKLPGPAPVKWLLTLILFTGLFFLLGGYFPVGVVLDAVQRSGGVAAGPKGAKRLQPARHRRGPGMQFG
mgnify:CR=1 FL=1